MDSTSYFLLTSHYWNCHCLVGFVLPSGNGGHFFFTSGQSPEPESTPCQEHVIDGQESLTVENLDKLEEQESLVSLRKAISSLFPKVDLPEILLEIHHRTTMREIKVIEQHSVKETLAELGKIRCRKNGSSAKMALIANEQITSRLR